MIFLMMTKLRLSFDPSFDPLSSQFSMLIKRWYYTLASLYGSTPVSFMYSSFMYRTAQ